MRSVESSVAWTNSWDGAEGYLLGELGGFGVDGEDAEEI